MSMSFQQFERELEVIDGMSFDRDRWKQIIEAAIGTLDTDRIVEIIESPRDFVDTVIAQGGGVVDTLEGARVLRLAFSMIEDRYHPEDQVSVPRARKSRQRRVGRRVIDCSDRDLGGYDD